MKKRSLAQTVDYLRFVFTQCKLLLLTAIMLIVGLSAGASTAHKKAPGPKISIRYASPPSYAAGTTISPLLPTKNGISGAGYSTAPTTLAAGLNSPISAAIDPAGNVYVCESALARVDMIPASGGPVVQFGSGFSYPTAVTTDAAGNVYVGDDGSHKLEEIKASDGSTTVLASNFNGILALAVDAAGNVYEADNGNSYVRKIAVGSGTAVNYISGFTQPRGLAIDGLGNIYVTDDDNTVKKVTEGSNKISVVATGFNQPTFIAVDGTGNLFVSDRENFRIVEVPANGTAPLTIGGGANFGAPNGVCADTKGNVIACDTYNGNVKQISPVGGFYIGSMLPAGLRFSNASGAIIGTPSAELPATDYFVTAYNAAGASASAKVTIQVTPASPASNAGLSLLSLSTRTALTKTEGHDALDYFTTVAPNTTSLNVNTTTADPDATVAINGNPVAGGAASTPVSLPSDPTQITIVVTAKDGVTTRSYGITVNKTGSSDAYLKPIQLSTGTVLVKTPGASDFNFNTSVGYHLPALTVTPTTDDPNATVTVNGLPVNSGMQSDSIHLADGGSTLINIVVTAQDGITQKTYTVNVTTSGSSNANLKGLVLSSRTVRTLTTGPSDVNYSTSVDPSLTSITVTPTAADPNSTITVNGNHNYSGQTSASITLDGAPTIITIAVLAEDGVTTKTYSIAVNKNGSSDANLAGLTVTPGTALTAATGSADANYATSVAGTVTSVMVKPTLDDANGSVTVNGSAVNSGTYSPPIVVGAGSTVINLLVTAPDGVTTKTYSVTVNNPGTGAALRVFVPKLVSDANTALVVHQALSPNGDGVNDHLVIEGISYHPDNKLTIMDSKGTLVYSKTGYDNNSNAFDGHSNNGTMQKPGVYFYSLQYKDGSQLMVKTGYIVLKY
jgi:gliding motility-associated-like protein